jgi:hypothetical protein
MTDEAIATELNISVATVRGYWLRVRSKLGGTTRAEFVGKWIQQGSNAESARVAQEHQDHSRGQMEDFQKLLADERSAMDKVFKDATASQRTRVRDIRSDSDRAVQGANEENSNGSANEGAQRASK